MESSSDDDNNDFIGGRQFAEDILDSEEEEKRQMEELMFCQLYFDPGNKISSDAKGNEYIYETVDLPGSNVEDENPGKSECILLSEEGNDANEENLDKSIKQQNENRISFEGDAKRTSKSDDKIHKTSSEDFKNVKSSSFLSNDGRKHLATGSALSLEAEAIDSNSYICIDSDDEELNVPSTTKRKRKTRRRKSKDKSRREEVLSISDDSSNSSIFIDVSSEDDNLDIHLNAGLTTNDKSLQKIHDSLPDCDWSICPADEFGQAKKSRYYNVASKVQCQNCSQRGHLRKECPQPRKAKACLLCGEQGHFSRSCRQSLCFRCNKPGHSVRDCDRKRNGREDYCCRCGVYGHQNTDCPDAWRQFHLTTIGGDIVTGAKLENHRKFCFNCAGSGHFGYECKREKSHHYVPTMLPFIAQYEMSGMKSQKHFYNATDPELSYKRRGRKKFKSYESENRPKAFSCESSSKKAEKHQYVKPHSESFDVLDSRAKSEKRNIFAGCVQSPSSKKKKAKQESASSLGIETPRGAKLDESGFLSHNLSSFAQNVKEKMLRKKLTPPKPRSKKTKKAKDTLQRSFIPFDETNTKELSNSPQNFHGLDRLQKPTDIADRMLSLSGTSLDKEGREEHNIGEGLCPNMKISLSVEDLNESNGKRSDLKIRSRSSRPSRQVSIGDTFIRDEPVQRSTPNERNLNGNWKDEMLSPVEMLQLDEDEMERSYYGRKQMRNAKRKERRKANKAKYKASGEASSVKKKNVHKQFSKKNSLPMKEDIL